MRYFSGIQEIRKNEKKSMILCKHTTIMTEPSIILKQILSLVITQVQIPLLSVTSVIGTKIGSSNNALSTFFSNKKKEKKSWYHQRFRGKTTITLTAMIAILPKGIPTLKPIIRPLELQ